MLFNSGFPYTLQIYRAKNVKKRKKEDNIQCKLNRYSMLNSQITTTSTTPVIGCDNYTCNLAKAYEFYCQWISEVFPFESNTGSNKKDNWWQIVGWCVCI